MNNLSGQFISNVAKNIYKSDPSFFKDVFNYNKKKDQVTFKQVLVNKVHANNNVSNIEIGKPAVNGSGNIGAIQGLHNGSLGGASGIGNNSGSVGNVGGSNGSHSVTDKNDHVNGSDLEKIFREAAEKYRVDVKLLKAMGKVESGFNPKAVSSAGAMGIMQLMPANCKEYGITDPFDPRQNIMGGAREIASYLKKYNGNLDLALAAYNAGPGNVSKYGGIPPFKETINYIKKVRKYMQVDIVIGGGHSHSNKVDKDKAEESLDKITYDKSLANVRIKY